MGESAQGQAGFQGLLEVPSRPCPDAALALGDQLGLLPGGEGADGRDVASAWALGLQQRPGSHVKVIYL